MVHTKVYGKKFPALQHLNLTSPSICRHSGTISGFDSRQVLILPKAPLQGIIGVVRLMEYKKGDFILQQCHCENLKYRNAREVCFISV